MAEQHDETAADDLLPEADQPDVAEATEDQEPFDRTLYLIHQVDPNFRHGDPTTHLDFVTGLGGELLRVNLVGNITEVEKARVGRNGR